jgi:hypothetical protein
MVQNRTPQEMGYGYPQPSFAVNPSPIKSVRAPTTADINYPIGQRWIDTTNATSWELTQVAAGSATWLSIGGTTTPTVANITATNFITATAATASTLNANSWSATGTNGNINLVVAPKGSGNFQATTGNIAAINGNITMGTAGNGIQIKEGANARLGTSAAMTAGSIVIANTSVTANTVVFLSPATTGGTQGALSVVLNPGVGFTINSSSATDTSTVNFLLIEKL